MPRNESLGAARAAKNDEYYTRLRDIEDELKHYKKHFKDKVVFCNCDDPYESNFFQYFAMNFVPLGLKKLICTCYDNSPIAGKELDLFSAVEDDEIPQEEKKGKAYKIIIDHVKDENGDGKIDITDVRQFIQENASVCTLLQGNGDFRSPECVALLRESDIVVTNPPFSLFREFIQQLMTYKKDFLILGNPNALHYASIFPYIKNNQIWIGYKSMSTDMLFYVSKEFEHWLREHKKEGSGWRIVDGVFYGRAAAIWYTNLDIKKRHEDIDLYKEYNPIDYPKYYNYEGINVDHVDDIPCDYFGEMGVPDSFLNSYNPDQFELIGIGSDVPKTKEHVAHKEQGVINYEVDGKILWTTPYTVSERKIGNSLRIDNNGLPGNSPYSRIIIKRKQ